jgi:hypothetical protein
MRWNLPKGFAAGHNGHEAFDGSNRTRSRGTLLAMRGWGSIGIVRGRRPRINFRFSSRAGSTADALDRATLSATPLRVKESPPLFYVVGATSADEN